MIGNHDGISVEKHNFSSPINAQFIRVHPIAHKGKICLRMELYGCSNRKLLIVSMRLFLLFFDQVKNISPGKLSVLWVLI